VAGGVKEFDRQWAQQQSIPQVTQNDTTQAQRLTESWDILKQRIEAEMRQILTTVSPALQKAFRGLGDWLNKHQAEFTQGIQNLLGWFSGPGPQQVVDGLVAIGDAAVAVSKFLIGLIHPFSSGAIAGKESGLFSDSDLGKWLQAKGDKAEFGIRQNRAERAEGIPEGILSYHKLPQDVAPEQLAHDLKMIHSKLGGDQGDPGWNKTVEYFNSHVSYGPIPDADKANAGAGASPKARALAGGKPTAFNESSPGGGSTSVRIDELNVYSAAQDATGIAGDLDNALQRKLTVSLADGALS